MRKFAPLLVVSLGLILALMLLVPGAAFAGTGTYPIDGTGVTLTMTTPNTYALCSSGNDTVTITGMPSDGSFQLLGQITVQYVLDGGGRQTVPNGLHPVNTTSDLSVQVSYPPIDQWPVQSNHTAEIHVDVSIEVYVNGNKDATLGPGQQWDVFCLDRPLATSTPTMTATGTPVPPSATPTDTATVTPTSTTSAPSATPTDTATATPTSTTNVPSATPTNTATPTSTTNAPSATPTDTATSAPIHTTTPTATPTTVVGAPSATPTSTPTAVRSAPSATPTSTSTTSAGGAPSATPTATNSGGGAPTATQTATVHSDGATPPAVATTSVTSSVGCTLINLTITVDRSQTRPGDVVVFTLTVSNPHPTDLTSVTVKQSLSSFANFQSATATRGQPVYDAQNRAVTLDIGTLPANQSVKLLVTAHVSAQAQAPGPVSSTGQACDSSGCCATASVSAAVMPAGIPVTGAGPGWREIATMLAALGAILVIAAGAGVLVRRMRRGP